MVVVVLASQPRFHFIGMSVMGLAVDLSEAESLAIGKVVSIETDIFIGFFGLSLW